MTNPTGGEWKQSTNIISELEALWDIDTIRSQTKIEQSKVEVLEAEILYLKAHITWTESDRDFWYSKYAALLQNDDGIDAAFALREVRLLFGNNWRDELAQLKDISEIGEDYNRSTKS